MIKLIATDMDGTWLNSKKQYDVVKFKQIMRLVTEQNIAFVIASGNQYENLLTRLPKEFWPRMYFVAENGSYVLHGHDPLSIQDFTDEEIQEIQEIESGLPGNSIWAGVESAYILKDYGEDFAKLIHHSNEKLQRVDTFSGIDDRFLKVTITTNPGDAEKVAKQLQAENHHVEIVAGCDWSIDFAKPGMSKASGLRLLGRMLRISPSEMVSFGDSENDVEMLKYTGYSYAMSTAMPVAKRTAKRIIGSCDDSAVQNEILRLLDKQNIH